MNLPAKDIIAKPIESSGYRWGPFTWLLAGLLAVWLAFRLAFGWAGYPGNNCDELIYVEPALNYVQTGKFSATGIAPQLIMKGVPGLEQQCFLAAPLGTYLRVPVMQLFGTDLPARRIADSLYYLLALGAFGTIVFRFCCPTLALATLLLFGQFRFIAWDAGRPDLLALGLGLSAFSLASGCFFSSDPAPRSKRITLLVAGVLVGLCGLAHPFGGIFWGFLITCVVLFLHTKYWGWRQALESLCFLGAGAVIGASFWLPQILSAPELWQKQFFYMNQLKDQLHKDFWISAQGLIITLRKNHTALLFTLLGCLLSWRLLMRVNLWSLLLGGTFLLAVWECLRFECYNGNYAAQFWAVFCLCFAFGFQQVFRQAGVLFPALPWTLIARVAIVGLLLESTCVSYRYLVEKLGFHNRDGHQAAIQVIGKNLGAGDAVLVTPACYFEVPSTNKTAWYWAENLDLNQFDIIVSKSKNVPVALHCDQWGDNIFTPAQAAAFAGFKLVAVIPPVPTRLPGLPESLTPSTDSLYIFRNGQSATR
jgi:hypothetical protein